MVVSFNDGIDAARGGLYFWPREFTLGNYTYIFQTAGMLDALGWSLARVVVGTVTKLVATGLLAYVTTVKHFSFHSKLRKMFLITMYVSGGMIPTYLAFIKLGLLESFTVYWLPSILSAYEMMIIASYIESLPDALFESARIDGAKEITIYTKICLPLCVPVFAALGVMVAVGHWNSWFDVILYNPSRQVRHPADRSAEHSDPVGQDQEADVRRNGGLRRSQERCCTYLHRVHARGYNDGRDHPDRAGVPLLPEVLRQGYLHRRCEGLSTHLDFPFELSEQSLLCKIKKECVST